MPGTRSSTAPASGAGHRQRSTPYRFVVPSLPPEMVRRGRLLELVDRGVAGTLTTVTAPAGSGKTVLLASWAAAAPSALRTCWFTLQPGDEDPRLFWSLLGDGLQHHGLPRVAPGVGAPTDAVAGVEAQLLSAAGPVVLVLDRADALASSPVGRDLSDLARRCGGALRLVVASRTEPAVGLHLFRLAGQLTEVRADALALTVPETTQVLHGAGLHLPPEDLARLHERTRGWPVGIGYAVMDLAGRTDVHDLAGDVGAYLASEVLDTHPPSLREALLRCSVVDRLDPGLVAALTGAGSGEDLLRLMRRGNVLVETVPDRPGEHRLQPLFRDFLRARLDAEHPGLVTVLHEAAADRLAADGHLLDSARHAALAGVRERTAPLLDVQGLVQLLVGPDSAQLASAYADAGPDVGPDAGATVVGAVTALLLGDDQRCASQLERARGTAAGATADVRDQVALAAVRAFLDERGPDPDAALVSVDVALATLPTAAAGPDEGLRAALLTCRARVLLRLGSTGCARYAAGEAVRLARTTRAPGLLAWAAGTAALVEALTGRLRDAVDLAGQSALAGEAAGWPVTYVHRHAATALAWVASQRADVPAAEEALARAVAALGDRDDAVVVAALGLVRTRLLRARGDVAVADERLRTLRGGGRVTWLVDPLPVDLGGAPLDASDRLDVRVAGLLQDATRLLADGERSAAGQRVEHALRLSAPERLRLPFLEVGPLLPAVLGEDALRRHGWLRLGPDPSARVPQMRQGSGARSEGARSDGGRSDGVLVVDTLTAKEREVLGHLAELLTTEEIATEMFVSVNTVRTHVRGILRKLSAQRRNEAVRRAWELNLLPRGSEPPPGRPGA